MGPSIALDGESTIEELHDKLANLQITANDKYDRERVIQKLGHICVELGALRDVIVPARKTNPVFRAFSDEKCESMKAGMLCNRQRRGTTINLEDIAARESSYHAMQVRNKVTAEEVSAGQHDYHASSCEHALNTTAYDGSCNPSRKQELWSREKRTSRK